MRRTGQNTRAASALIIVLVVVLALSTLVASIAFDAQLELKYASFARRRAQCEELAVSGMAIATMLMNKQRTISPNDLGADDDRWHEAAERLALGRPLLGLVEPLGEGEVVLDIVPEPGRRNVNLLMPEDWERVLGNAGVPEEHWPMMIDSFYDWLDPDDMSRQDGAETDDYYARLDPPYRAKNGPLDTVRELLLVRGFTEAVLQGGILREEEMDPLTAATRFQPSSRFVNTNEVWVSGIEHLLTTYGDGKVNVQSASRDVLMTLPDVDDIAAMAIIEERGDFDEPGEEDTREPFRNINDMFARVPGLNMAIADQVTVSSEYFRIISVGRVGRVERKLSAIVHFDGTETRILRWSEDL